jgi:hypothetical protein
MTEDDDPRPMGGYAALLAVYLTGASLAVLGLRGHKERLTRLSLGRLVVLGLATQHLSRLIAKDSILAPLRAPFTRFVEPTGEGEVSEEVVGTGLRHAVGELLTCPYCIGQWVATALVAGTVAAPVLTDAVVSVCALARVSDWLQLAYDKAKGDG